MINIMLFWFIQSIYWFDGDIIAEGDDGLIGLNDIRAVELLQTCYKWAGLELKLEVHQGLDECTFCKVTFYKWE